MNKYLLFNFLLFLTWTGSLVYASDSLIYTNHVFDDNIKTVQLYREEWNLSYPVMKLRVNDKLVLHFDLLGNNPETYYYTFIHCNRDWMKSDIYPSDYLDGYAENQIEKYHPSFNTTVAYFHYSMTFPNERVKFKLSGNYILLVYPVGEPDKPVLSRRFIITDDIVRISGSVQRPQMKDRYNTGQQVDFNISYTGADIADPYHDITCVVLQNGQWSNAKMNLSPDFVSNSELKYTSLSDKNIFPGGNEFRYFDIRSVRYQSEYVRKTDFTENQYHVFLFPSENREIKPYFYWQDFNGKYYVAIQEGRDMDTEADYLWVYFTLPSKYKVPEGNLFVTGALNDWLFNPKNLMHYDPDRAEYQCSMLLKQGWYNYEYILTKNGERSYEPSVFEGNHYETENDYLIMVYYRNPRARYDRVIGSLILNSTKRSQN